MALIEVRGLKKAFGDVVVLDGVDLDIERGEFVTLMGVSGSGKSLLVKMLIGLLPADAGTIRFDGEDVTHLPEHEWTPVRRRIGMLFQEYALFDSMSVFDNVAYGLREQRLMPEPQIAERVKESLDSVSLPDSADLWPKELSGGMKKRVALARAIAMHPEVVFYDEPTEGLDPINVTRVDRLMLRLRAEKGITSVIVTHNMQSAFKISDRLIFLHDGQVALTGTPDELRARREDPRLRHFVEASLKRLPRRSRPPGMPSEPPPVGVP